jgi:hypothetical protein
LADERVLLLACTAAPDRASRSDRRAGGRQGGAMPPSASGRAQRVLSFVRARGAAVR